MKNLFIYYLAILMPFPLMIWALYTSPVLFVSLLISYYFYRGFVDGQRLIDLGVLKSNRIYLSFIPFWTSRYFGILYFGKGN